MGFLILCPNCGKRSVYEFSFGGEHLKMPALDASDREWYDYVYGRRNVQGIEKEWWYHRLGCKRWFFAMRDTRNNLVIKTFHPDEDEDSAEAGTKS